MLEEQPKEWNPEYKKEEPLINDTSGGFSNRGFGQNTRVQTIQIGKGENMFQVDASGFSNILMQAGKSLQFTSVTAPIACVATLVATDTGNIDNGTHKYKITYVNATGETELGAVSNEVTVDATHKQVDLSGILESGSGSVIARKIYRTKAGGILYYLLDTMSNNSETTYTDNTADASLGVNGTYRADNTFGKIIVNNVICGSFASNNTFLGLYTGRDNTTGDGNTFIGQLAGRENTTGYDNTFLGTGAGYKTITGYGNTAIGEITLSTNTIGYNNVAVGVESLVLNTTGYDNVGIGYRTLAKNTTGSGNIGIGAYAGFHDATSNSLFINNRDRTNQAGDRTKSLVWGQMADAAANQTIRFNARVVFAVSKTPANANEAGILGEICWDASYIYVCTALNAPYWERVAIAAW